ncbi:peroxisomal biogenesis factor 3 [Plasmopara halstedii]|uniref:Peroxisomal biogenesis factor 3 n=1 Tax=Plasmopara halstedii TaxID=4781 RepID=A0A0P1ACJ1_PLAHL|nr:peroxisomal biogenesis factor 3 [Plasmopara halstedii]CEG37940.1 peroxisomal biogenesis factor 3 [Plasmopara halstedii]|eukprot:XP_024574309.1 peroxisomal biogenesis factor 3 [Plasmopara halstedii]
MWSAFQHAKHATCGFIHRHKKLLIATTIGTACAGTAFYAYKRIQSEAERFNQQIQMQMAEHQRLQLALNSTVDESRAMVKRFLPRLKSRLYQLLDLESVVQELKMLDKTQKKRRNALWEDAKLLAFTRYMTSLIAFGLWHMLVFAQVSIIGKRMFEKNLKMEVSERQKQREEAEEQAHHAFLTSGLEYFLDEALERIKNHVETIVKENKELQAWKVSQKAAVTTNELNEVLQTLFLDILPSTVAVAAAEKHEDSAELRKWRGFLVYPEKLQGQDENLISLLNDLWDLLESNLFLPALQHSLGFLCGNAFQDLDDVVYGPRNSEPQDVENHDAKPEKPAPPLAKLIPCLQAEMNKLLLSSGPDSYAAKYSQEVGEIETFRSFYEAIFFEQSAKHQYMGSTLI